MLSPSTNHLGPEWTREQLIHVVSRLESSLRKSPSSIERAILDAQLGFYRTLLVGYSTLDRNAQHDPTNRTPAL